MRIFSNLLLRHTFAAAKEPSGSVYTWTDKTITKLELPEKAKRVSLGEKHSAIVGESG